MIITMANYAKFESFEAKKLDVFIQLGKDLNEDVLSEMLTTYLQTTEDTLKSLKSNFAKKDFKAIARLAHKQKSSSGQLGLNKLHKLCTDLENLGQGTITTPVEADIDVLINLIHFETNLTTDLLNNFLKAA